MEIRDTLLGQIRHEFPKAVMEEWERVAGTDPLPVCWFSVEAEGKRINFLHVAELNIKDARRNHPGNAVWRIRGTDTKAHPESDRILASADAVIVSYGPSRNGGEIWPESSGNDRKGSYRRLALTKDITGAPYGKIEYDEIDTICKEENFRLLWEGKPLERRSDYAEGV